MPNPENIEKHQFKKGQSGNPKGRPPKAISQITKDLIKEGYKIPSKTDILDAGLMLMSLTTEKVKDIAEGVGDKKDYPFYYPRVAQELLSYKGHEIIEKILDRALGKATQKTDVTSGGDKIEPQPTFVVSSQESEQETEISSEEEQDLENEEECLSEQQPWSYDWSLIPSDTELSAD